MTENLNNSNFFIAESTKCIHIFLIPNYYYVTLLLQIKLNVFEYIPFKTFLELL